LIFMLVHRFMSWSGFWLGPRFLAWSKKVTKKGHQITDDLFLSSSAIQQI
jgi:hypothetical protein